MADKTAPFLPISPAEAEAKYLRLCFDEPSTLLASPATVKLFEKMKAAIGKPYFSAAQEEFRTAYALEQNRKRHGLVEIVLSYQTESHWKAIRTSNFGE